MLDKKKTKYSKVKTSTNNNNNSSLLEFVQNLAEKEDIDSKMLENIISKSVSQVYCQNENENVVLSFEIYDNLIIYRHYNVVSSVQDNNLEILNNSPLIKQGKVRDNVLLLPLDINNFPFSSIQEISRNISSAIQSIKQQKNMKLLKGQKNELIKGKIKAFRADYCEVELEGGNIGFWAKQEWQNIIRPYIGQISFFLIKDIISEADSKTKIILTHSNSDILYKVATLEIPEIREGEISIRHILRIPGVLSKIIVQSNIVGVDPIGACIGASATRIHNIKNNINWKNTNSNAAYSSERVERVEIAIWQDDKQSLLFSLLSPIRVISLIMKKDEWRVIIPSCQFYIMKNRWDMLDLIGQYLEKKINIDVLEDLENKGSHIIIWNGNINPEEYKNLIVNDRNYSQN